MKIVGHDAGGDLQERSIRSIEAHGDASKRREVGQIADVRARVGAVAQARKQNVFLSSAPQARTGAANGGDTRTARGT